MNNSKFFSLNLKDLFRGFIMTALGVIAHLVYELFEKQTFPTGWEQWKAILLSGAFAGLVYLCKNFLSGVDGKFLRPGEPVK